VTGEANPAFFSRWNAISGGIMWAGKNLITNATKSLPSLLTVNHIVSDAGQLKYCKQICQSAKLLIIELFSSLKNFQFNWTTEVCRHETTCNKLLFFLSKMG
jgi:hypothetical protein